MADVDRVDQQHPPLNLSPAERSLFGSLFSQADTDSLGVITGERAVPFFEKTRLSSDVLGEIWQIADTENRGLLTPPGFAIVGRLIGWAQSGRLPPTKELAYKPGGPLPRFDGISLPQTPTPAQPLQQQNSGAIRVPPLNPDRVAQYTSLFEESGAQNGVLSGETAKSIFERAQLPNETLGKIWALADSEQKGYLGVTEFVIAMHLLTSTKTGSLRALPQTLPQGLYEAASRKPPAARSRPSSNNAPSAIPRQFSGGAFPSPQQSTPTGDGWAITPQDKAQFDSIFATVDTQNRGFITGDQAVTFFGNSRLPEEALAQIWDLADINSEGILNKDEFAVAMYLIRQQRSKTAGRDVLPSQLPPNLIPPSMRRQPIAPQQPTAPAFDNAANITAPKSASEDLFGLDAISSPQAAPLQPKSTGDSAKFATPPRSQASPPPGSAQNSRFKPFVPSSSFGQSIMTPGPGAPGPASPGASGSAGAQKSASDDLLGDTDPEVSKRLTTETTDLANLSNQVSTLTGQMQDIRSKHGTTAQEINQANSQKQQFEARLTELRSAYEQEVREVRSLEDRLRGSREETRKIQSDIAMLSGTHEDLKTQHQQIAQALQADQQENANLKERIRQTNVEIEQLKPQVEKMRSDARHQKGLVAINKKQLATHEAEREKVRGDMDGASEEHAQATRDLDQSQRDLDSASQAKVQSTAAQPAAVASPAPSTASMNPFFRIPSGSPQAERSTVGSPFAPPAVTSPNHNAFDSFFGSTAPSATPPPPTSFRSDSPGVPREGAKGSTQPSADGIGSATPPTSPPQSVSTDSPATASEPPAPPQSRQITSSFLPLRPNLDHSPSESSSVRVVPPASRMGEPADTPSRLPSEAQGPQSPMPRFEDLASKPAQDPASELTPSSTGQQASIPSDFSKGLGPPSAAGDVPGAFPGDETPMEKSQEGLFASDKSPYSGSGLDPRVDTGASSGTVSQAPHLQAGVSDPFGKSSTPTSAKDDFESAFEGFTSNKGKEVERQNGAVSDDPFAPAAPGAASGEFPPIRELEHDDSDSESERGFADDFNARAANSATESGPNQALQGQGATVDEGNGLAPPPAPARQLSTTSDPPTPGAQPSPPTYENVTGLGNGVPGLRDRETSKSFPSEYSGLLPSREEPVTSPPAALSKSSTVHSDVEVPAPSSGTGVDPGLDFFPTNSTPGESSHTAGKSGSEDNPLGKVHSPMAPGASMDAPFAYTSNSPPSSSAAQPAAIGNSSNTTAAPSLPAKVPPTPTPAADDDFADFEDLAPAIEEGDDAEQHTGSGRGTGNGGFEFDPTFDSPPPAAASNPGRVEPGPPPGPPPLSSYQTSGSGGVASAGKSVDVGTAAAAGKGKADEVSHDWDAIFAGLDGGSSSTAPAATNDAAAAGGGGSSADAFAALNSAGGGGKGGVSGAEDGADDDPILKRLITMGFPRSESLRALERYDYNIDKAAEYLVSKAGS